ncbi:MAG: ABC transporter permease [Balneolaceae bacterium]|nr:ABC transporter permease [Balneolaceae bacterium]
MNVIQFISRRYLFSKKHISLISVLTSISIAGITIGTALLIIILSVFNGFFDVIRSYLLSFDPDIRVELVGQPNMLYDPELLDQVREHPEVVSVAPYIEGKAMMVFQNGRNEVLTVRGIESDSDILTTQLAGLIADGTTDLSVIDGRPGVIVSESLVNRYRLDPNDEIAMLSPTGMRRALTQFSAPRVSRFDVRSSYNMHQIVEGDVVYIDMTAAQRLFNMRNEITGFDLQLKDTDRAETVKADLVKTLGEDYRIQTWYDLQKPLYDVMYLEKWGSYFILMIIVMVAVLNIVGSLTMIVIQKKRDIGVLISMGMTPKRIKNIFRSQGLQIGLIGCGLGGILGIGMCLAQQEFSLFKLSSSFIIDAYPVTIRFFDVGIVLAGTMVLCLLASWYPAVRAASIQPADAVRDE